MPRAASISVSPLLALAALLGACTLLPQSKPPQTAAAQLTLTAVSFGNLRGWRQDAQGAALAALVRSCARFGKLADGRSLGAGGIAGTVAHWRPVCAAAGGLDAGDHGAARRFFETWFRPYLAAGDSGPEGLFTGYYEAELRGAWTPRGRYRVPVYARPGDLISVDLRRFGVEGNKKSIVGRVSGSQLVPYAERAAIDGGAISGRGFELLWVDDAVDAFFLHIQGSGRVVMEDGQVVRLGYAAKHGHPYVAIGRALIERGEIAREAMSMQAIRAWLGAHPKEGAALMASNPSYVFFRMVEGEGPIGAQGVALTPGRSLAVDRRFVPLGLPVWLDTTHPLDAAAPLRRLVVAQDTGGVIKGPVRGDLFWGFGAEAALPAGHMKGRGRYYLLLPKSVAPPD